MYRLPEIAWWLLRQAAANQAAVKPNRRPVSAGSKIPKSIDADRRTYFSTASTRLGSGVCIAGVKMATRPLLPQHDRAALIKANNVE
jgi:hypothetical protein